MVSLSKNKVTQAQSSNKREQTATSRGGATASSYLSTIKSMVVKPNPEAADEVSNFTGDNQMINTYVVSQSSQLD